MSSLPDGGPAIAAARTSTALPPAPASRTVESPQPRHGPGLDRPLPLRLEAAQGPCGRRLSAAAGRVAGASMTTTMKCRFAWRSGCVIENRATPRQGTLRRHDFDGACPESGVEQTPSDRRDRPIAGSECRFAASLLRSRSGSDPRPEGAHRVASIGQMQARRSSVVDRDLPLSILVARRRTLRSPIWRSDRRRSGSSNM